MSEIRPVFSASSNKKDSASEKKPSASPLPQVNLAHRIELEAQREALAEAVGRFGVNKAHAPAVTAQHDKLSKAAENRIAGSSENGDLQKDDSMGLDVLDASFASAADASFVTAADFHDCKSDVGAPIEGAELEEWRIKSGIGRNLYGTPNEGRVVEREHTTSAIQWGLNRGKVDCTPASASSNAGSEDGALRDALQGYGELRKTNATAARTTKEDRAKSPWRNFLRL